ncbi:hypothetical protein VCV18_012385 [Metarhizium anisopliae]
MTRLVTVALYHRDHHSEGRSRQIFGYDAYHWGIIVMPESSKDRDCNTYEATDLSEMDPITFRIKNPRMDWWYREKENINPELGSKLIGRIVFGQIPEHSCVTWTVNAILALQKKNWAGNFDIEPFKDWALAYADDRMKGLDSTQPKVVTYCYSEKAGQIVECNKGASPTNLLVAQTEHVPGQEA